MRLPLLLANFDDRKSEREALVSVHVRYLVAILGVVRANADERLLRAECVRFLDESLWAVTEIRPGLKYDTRFVSEAVKLGIEEHNAAPDSWQYAGPNEDWVGRTDPRTCAEHEHVVPRKQLREQLLAADPTPVAIEAVLRRARACLVTDDEHANRKLHGTMFCTAWERYAKADIRVWDRTLGEWVVT